MQNVSQTAQSIHKSQSHFSPSPPFSLFIKKRRNCRFFYPHTSKSPSCVGVFNFRLSSTAFSNAADFAAGGFCCCWCCCFFVSIILFYYPHGGGGGYVWRWKKERKRKESKTGSCQMWWVNVVMTDGWTVGIVNGWKFLGNARWRTMTDEGGGWEGLINIL